MRKWTDKDELEKIHSNAYEIASRCDRCIQLIKSMERGKENKLPNIGTIYNNKMNDIYHYINDRGIIFHNSSVKNGIAHYFSNLIG